MQIHSTLRTCTICTVTSNSDASLQRHLQSKAHRAAVKRAAGVVASSGAAAAAAAASNVATVLCSPLLSPVASSLSPLAEPPSNPSRATAAASFAAAAAPATVSVAAPVTSSTHPRAPLASPVVSHHPHNRQPQKASKSSKQQDGFNELVEANGQGQNSSAQHSPPASHSAAAQQPPQQQQQQPQQQSYACRICDVQCHSSANLHDHVDGTSHAKCEGAFLRGMHAALDYLSLSVSCAPSPPSAMSVAADPAASNSSAPATPVAFDVLTADGEVNHLYMTAVNPAVRAMCDSLRAHEQGIAWRSLLAAVRGGMSEQQQWSSAFALRQRFHRLAAAAAHTEESEGNDDDDADYEEQFDEDDLIYYDEEEEY